MKEWIEEAVLSTDESLAVSGDVLMRHRWTPLRPVQQNDAHRWKSTLHNTSGECVCVYSSSPCKWSWFPVWFLIRTVRFKTLPGNCAGNREFLAYLQVGLCACVSFLMVNHFTVKYACLRVDLTCVLGIVVSDILLPNSITFMHL